MLERLCPLEQVLECLGLGKKYCSTARAPVVFARVISRPGVPGRGDVRLTRDAPARCSESDGRMIYGVNEAITGMVLRRLENQGSYDILMNGFSLQSNTTPRKAWGVLEGQSRLEKTYMVEYDRGKWVVQSAFGIVKHGGVTPINLGKSQPPP
ncbi:unnamed protein product [Prunus armeniaca]